MSRNYFFTVLLGLGALLLVSCYPDTIEPISPSGETPANLRNDHRPYTNSDPRILLTFQVMLEVDAPDCPEYASTSRESEYLVSDMNNIRGCLGPFKISAKGHGYNDVLGPISSSLEFNFVPITGTSEGFQNVVFENDESYLLFKFKGAGRMEPGYLKDMEYVIPLELVESTSKIYNGKFEGEMHIRNADELFAGDDKTFNTAVVIYGTFNHPG